MIENFHKWNQYCEADPRQWVELGFSCLWEVRDEEAGEGEYWLSDFRNTAQVSPLNYSETSSERDFDIFLLVNRQACEDIFHSRRTAQEAFLSGDLQVAGEMKKVLLLNLMFALLKETVGE